MEGIEEGCLCERTENSVTLKADCPKHGGYVKVDPTKRETHAGFLVKRLAPDAQLPRKEDVEDLGFDIFWCGHRPVEEIEFVGMTQWVIPTGIAVSLPRHWGIEIRDRSGWARKHGAHIVGGIIDEGYRGEYLVMVQFPHRLLPEAGGSMELNSKLQPFRYDLKPGSKIAQLLLRFNPEIQPEEADELPPSRRDTKGFGSSDDRPSEEAAKTNG